jgi:hypothetical protein
MLCCGRSEDFSRFDFDELRDLATIPVKCIRRAVLFGTSPQVQPRTAGVTSDMSWKSSASTGRSCRRCSYSACREGITKPTLRSFTSELSGAKRDIEPSTRRCRPSMCFPPRHLDRGSSAARAAHCICGAGDLGQGPGRTRPDGLRRRPLVRQRGLRPQRAGGRSRRRHLQSQLLPAVLLMLERARDSAGRPHPFAVS